MRPSTVRIALNRREGLQPGHVPVVVGAEHADEVIEAGGERRMYARRPGDVGPWSLDDDASLSPHARSSACPTPPRRLVGIELSAVPSPGPRSRSPLLTTNCRCSGGLKRGLDPANHRGDGIAAIRNSSSACAPW
jgi:hypothetical protein